jgi:hypothetical protein
LTFIIITQGMISRSIVSHIKNKDDIPGGGISSSLIYGIGHKRPFFYQYGLKDSLYPVT